METYYNIQHGRVSLVFLSPVAGFILSTLCNHPLHARFGQRGIVIIAGICQITAYTIACLHPPFSGLVVTYILVGMGSGAKQAAWNSYVGGLQNQNELLGFLHGFYGIGATLTPSVSSILITKRGWQWYEIYYILVGMSVSDMVFTFFTFMKQNGKAYRNESQSGPGSETAEPESSSNATYTSAWAKQWAWTRWKLSAKNNHTVACLKAKPVIMCSCFLLSYVGSEVALGGWIVSFMETVRHGSAFKSGLVSSGFWAGITIGRMMLGFVTARAFKSEKTATSIYLVGAGVMQLLFWRIPSFNASAICASLLGNILTLFIFTIFIH